MAAEQAPLSPRPTWSCSRGKTGADVSETAVDLRREVSIPAIIFNTFGVSSAVFDRACQYWKEYERNDGLKPTESRFENWN